MNLVTIMSLFINIQLISIVSPNRYANIHILATQIQSRGWFCYFLTIIVNTLQSFYNAMFWFIGMDHVICEL